MDVSISWHTPYHNILYVKFYGKWTWFGLNRTGQNISQEVKTQSDYVDTIIDMQTAASAPTHKDNHALRSLLESMPHNHGVMVFFGADRFTEMILNILKSSAPILDRKVMLASTRQEALMMIAERREKRTPARSVQR